MYFNESLGLRRGEDGTSLELDTREEHQVVAGTIHFAVLTTMAEIVAAQATGVAVVPASVTVHLLRRARAGHLVARGRLLRRGRSVAVAEGEVSQDGELVAKATVNFAVLAPAG